VRHATGNIDEQHVRDGKGEDQAHDAETCECGNAGGADLWREVIEFTEWFGEEFFALRV
jgi:hypothetical protein